MAEQERQQNVAQQQGQSQQQLQGLLRQTLKENKSLQNKNAKLESKYVELFKEQKALKKDHSLFIAFFNKYFAKNTQDSRPRLPQIPPGQYQMQELQKIAEQKEGIFREKVQQLENRRQQLQSVLQQLQSDRKRELQLALRQKEEELTKNYQQRLKEANDISSKEINSLLKQLESLRRSNKQQSEQLAQLKTSLELKHNELSKLGKEKLKLQHQLNNIRKKEIAEELSPQQERKNQKTMNERNEFLSLRQQLEATMIKRDQLKRELTEKQQQISAQRTRNQALQREIQRLRKNQADLDQKYELVRQCTLEQLESLILGQQVSKQQKKEKEPPANDEPVNQQNAQIQHEYLKNILLRYIKAETTGSFDQALMSLQIIGTILKLDADSSTALENYKNKRKQWWYIKY